jgi:hypothetical protein
MTLNERSDEEKSTQILFLQRASSSQLNFPVVIHHTDGRLIPESTAPRKVSVPDLAHRL